MQLQKSNYVLANSYNYLYGAIFNRLTIFYSLWAMGRPDMALFKFTKNIIKKN